MDVYQPDRRRRGRARDRIAARQRKQMATPSVARNAPEAGTPIDGRSMRMQRRSATLPLFGAQQLSDTLSETGFRLRGGGAARDFWWRARGDRRIWLVGAVFVVLLVFTFLFSYIGQNRIFPNVWALGVSLGGMTVDEAAAALQAEFEQEARIRLIDQDRQWELRPAQLGIQLNARATAEAARAVGLGGLPFGYSVQPVVSIDVLRAQDTLLDYTEIVNIVPYNAGYRWEGDTLVGVPGRDGRFLDVALTMQRLEEGLVDVVDQRQLHLVMAPAAPDVLDPTPYLDRARALASTTFILRGYDPFTNEQIAWTPDRDTFTSWLQAGSNSLSVRPDLLADYINERSEMLAIDNPLRYLEPSDSIDKVRQAVESGRSYVDLRVRYRTSTYTVQRGDSGYRIARRTGVPFYLLQQANPNRNWNALLSPGEQINLPSPDLVVPLDPVPNKRIIVNLDTQTLYAFENGQLVFNWLISSGMDRAPTSPGIYQIINHDELATGSSIELCGDTSCGSWQMYWFMGIYEVVPGLINGFHGAVLLPGGTYLGGGNVGRPYTYGCIMSQNDNAEQLFRWAEVGTMVEIISREYPPRSDLGRMVLQQAQQAGEVSAAI